MLLISLLMLLASSRILDNDFGFVASYVLKVIGPRSRMMAHLLEPLATGNDGKVAWWKKMMSNLEYQVEAKRKGNDRRDDEYES